jgi:hypothetical protein
VFDGGAFDGGAFESVVGGAAEFESVGDGDGGDAGGATVVVACGTWV